MKNKVPKRIASTVMNSLKGGVVPRVGLEYITVGRKDEINAILHDIDIIEAGGAAFRFIVGKYGSGKSFLLQTIRNYAMEKGFVIVDADLSPERRLHGTNKQGLATYKELIKNMSTKTRTDGGALALILEKWISQIQMDVTRKNEKLTSKEEFSKEIKNRIYDVIEEIHGLVNGFDFANLILAYWDAFENGDDEKKYRVLKWFRGEYSNKTEAKKELGVNLIVDDDNWYDFLKIFSVFLVKAGYKGLLILIDELVNIYKIPNSITRQYNYEKILTMYNDVLQGKANYIGIFMGGTPQCIEDTYKGVYSYEALRSRLTEGRFSTEETRDLLAPIIRIKPLESEEMFVLIEKLSQIHEELYDYVLNISNEDLVNFLKIEYERVGTKQNVTPREIIRDFIELLNIVYQNPNKTIKDIFKENNFKFAEDTITEEKIHEEFSDFEV